MKKFVVTLLTVATSLAISEAVAKPIDLTGLTCLQHRGRGPVTWDFYGDVAIREYPAGDAQQYGTSVLEKARIKASETLMEKSLHSGTSLTKVTASTSGCLQAPE